MQGKDTIESTFDQLFSPILSHEIMQWIKNELKVDRYVKKLTIDRLFILMAFAQLHQLEGLREIANVLNDERFGKAVGLESISYSTISRRMATVSTEAFEALFKPLASKTGSHMNVMSGRIYHPLRVIDASTITLSLTRYRCAEFRNTTSGVKLHLRLRLFGPDVLPDKVVITPAKVADNTQMDSLVAEDPDAINVFDRGYLDYGKFDEYCKEKIHFVTRLKANAIVHVLEEQPCEESDTIRSDSIVLLGAGKDQMEHPLRLIKAVDTEGNAIAILTNVHYMSAEEIGDIYRNRWQIELFFKWIKQHFTVKHFYGQSDQAVANQLYIALIMHCLLTILKVDSGYRGALLEFTRCIKTCLFDLYQLFLEKLCRKPSRSSRGRCTFDHDTVFQQTLSQVIAGEVDHLYDLTYDPVIL